MENSNYVCCGVDTLISIWNRFFEETGNEYLTQEKLRDFLSITTNKFLYSYGSSLNYKTKKIPKSQNETFNKMVGKLKDNQYMDKSLLYIDSGGFQVANGAIETKDMPKFIDMYYNAIVENKDKIDHAFLLDLPPGPGSKDIFSSYDQIHELNELSYRKCIEIVPEDIRREKMIYVHHFRTPQLLKIWNDLLRNKKLGDGYTYYSIGGLVANLSTSHKIPILMIALPLINLINYLKDNGIKKFKFHILGGAQFSEVFTYHLYQKHLKHFHDIDIQITFDSSMIFKSLLMGRVCYLFDNNGNLNKPQLKSNALHLNFDDQTLEDKLYEEFKIISDMTGMKELNKDNSPIYDIETNTFSKPVQINLFLYCLKLYKIIEEQCKKNVDEIYEIYLKGDEKYFYDLCIDNFRKLSEGRTTRKQRIKAISIRKTLDLLKSLDLEKANHYITKYMSGDDISIFSAEDSGLLKF